MTIFRSNLCRVDVLWEGRTRQECQGPHSLKCTGNLSTTLWKMKLMAKRKDRMEREKKDSKETKVELSKRSKHTTWAHEDDTWNVMCARQTYDLSHACACHLLCKYEKFWRVRCAVHTPRRLQQTAVSRKRSDYNNRSICCSFTSSDVLDILLIVRSSIRNRSTATKMCWMKKTTDAISGVARKESVRLALLQTWILSDFKCGQASCITTKFNHLFFFFLITCPLVLGTFAIDLLAQDHRSKVCVSSSHLARTMG